MSSTHRPRQSARSRQIVGIIRSLLLLAALIAITVWISRASPGVRVVTITTSKLLDSNFIPVEPTTVFGPGDTFYVAVRLEGYRAGLPLIARWSYEGQPIHETQLDTSHVGDLYAGFSLDSDKPWAAGRYAVDIVLNSKIISGTSFRVEEQP